MVELKEGAPTSLTKRLQQLWFKSAENNKDVTNTGEGKKFP